MVARPAAVEDLTFSFGAGQITETKHLSSVGSGSQLTGQGCQHHAPSGNTLAMPADGGPFGLGRFSHKVAAHWRNAGNTSTVSKYRGAAGRGRASRRGGAIGEDRRHVSITCLRRFHNTPHRLRIARTRRGASEHPLASRRGLRA